MWRMALATGLVATAAPAFAQDVRTGSQHLQLAGAAPAACVLGAPTVSAARNASFAITGASSAAVTIDQLADPQSALSLASAVELSLPVACNAPNTVSLGTTNGGLRRSGSRAGVGAPGGFSEFVGYRLGLDWAGQTIDQASTASGTIVAAQPGRGALALRVATVAGTGPLVAGRYDDAIVIEFRVAN